MSKLLTALGSTNTVILGISLSQAYSLVGLILFILQIIILIVNLVVKAVRYLKDGSLDDNELEDLANDIKDISDKINERSGE